MAKAKAVREARPVKKTSEALSSGDKLQGIQSVETGFAVLDALADGDGPLSLGEVARNSDLSPSQARRYLVSLVRCGLATQDTATGRYDLGSRSLRIGLAALARVDAIELASSALKDMVAKIHEAGSLAVWGDEGPTVIRWLRGGGIGVTSLGLGTIFPLLSSATGHVFLAHLPNDMTRDKLRREVSGPALSSVELRERLETIKSGVLKSGYGWLKGHFVDNIRGAAAPIFDSQGELIAVLAIAGPERRDAKGHDSSVEALVNAAALVSEQLCHRPPSLLVAANGKSKDKKNGR
ncbi:MULTISPECIES: IclR family transcriptional regulator [unclassified Beijerinckia]|uniref:IclR family transcriptional regulator n=1 Tax=unclassified Beijerinckia TaxID=2638183 RepID=UPI00089CC0A9|nr:MULTISPECIES: IclR family transcriptional regulator [unclassified Beijerinckia]MDH7795861.1 DNA-binding IclR family transcriptional regulator [Beijerinckia sp. GAS462]SEC19613.1 transcriptional regulator, IclR family [Beijerinckia sp. 28-YEA-48]